MTDSHIIVRVKRKRTQVPTDSLCLVEDMTNTNSDPNKLITQFQNLDQSTSQTTKRRKYLVLNRVSTVHDSKLDIMKPFSNESIILTEIPTCDKNEALSNNESSTIMTNALFIPRKKSIISDYTVLDLSQIDWNNNEGTAVTTINTSSSINGNKCKASTPILDPATRQLNGAILIALQRNDFNGIQLALSSGANINHRTTDATGGWTAIMVTAKQLNIRMIKRLLGYCVDVSIKNAEGFTALDIIQQSTVTADKLELKLECQQWLYRAAIQQQQGIKSNDIKNILSTSMRQKVVERLVYNDTRNNRKQSLSSSRVKRKNTPSMISEVLQDVHVNVNGSEIEELMDEMNTSSDDYVYDIFHHINVSSTTTTTPTNTINTLPDSLTVTNMLSEGQSSDVHPSQSTIEQDMNMSTVIDTTNSTVPMNPIINCPIVPIEGLTFLENGDIDIQFDYDSDWSALAEDDDDSDSNAENHPNNDYPDDEEDDDNDEEDDEDAYDAILKYNKKTQPYKTRSSSTATGRNYIGEGEDDSDQDDEDDYYDEDKNDKEEEDDFGSNSNHYRRHPHHHTTTTNIGNTRKNCTITKDLSFSAVSSSSSTIRFHKLNMYNTQASNTYPIIRRRRMKKKSPFHKITEEGDGDGNYDDDDDDMDLPDMYADTHNIGRVLRPHTIGEGYTEGHACTTESIQRLWGEHVSDDDDEEDEDEIDDDNENNYKSNKSKNNRRIQDMNKRTNMTFGSSVREFDKNGLAKYGHDLHDDINDMLAMDTYMPSINLNSIQPQQTSTLSTPHPDTNRSAVIDKTSLLFHSNNTTTYTLNKQFNHSTSMKPSLDTVAYDSELDHSD